MNYIGHILSIAQVTEPFKELRPEYEDILKKVLLVDPFLRMTASQVLQHSVFSSIRMPQLESQITHPILLEVDQMSINASSGEPDE